MKQGIFSIENGIPIVFAYGLLKPKRADYHFDIDFFIHDLKEYESSRKEWKIQDVNNIHIALLRRKTLLNCNVLVEFKEITPPTDKKRGKCKILRIES